MQFYKFLKMRKTRRPKAVGFPIYLTSIDLASIDLISISLISIGLISISLISIDLISIDLISINLAASSAVHSIPYSTVTLTLRVTPFPAIT